MLNRENYNDLHTFLIAATERNFSRAAAKFGVSPPALSKTIRLLEERLGVQLFQRTTRTVSLTQAGEQLFRTAESSFSKLNNELSALEHYRNTPSGLVKITAGLPVVQTLLIPKLAHFQQKYPQIRLEIISENRFVDIVAEGFDAGVRLGSDVGEQMIAVRISDEMKMAVVASPAYLQQFGVPQQLPELAQHHCIGYRLGSGGEYQWAFDLNGEIIKVQPQGQWIFNDDLPAKTAALHGLGIAYLPADLVADELASGALIKLFGEYGQRLPALYLYYPHRNISPALRAVVDALRV